MPTPTQVINEPYRNYRYLVEIDGFTSAGFSKVTGLDMEHEVVAYREGGENTRERKLPGQTKFSPVVLERGATSNMDMWEWASKVHTYAGNPATNVVRKTVTIVLIGRNADGSQIRLREWTLQNAWVSKWEVGELDAKANDVLLERITIQHEGIVKGDTTKDDVPVS